MAALERSADLAGLRQSAIQAAKNIRVRLATADDAFDILVVRAASWRATYKDILSIGAL